MSLGLYESANGLESAQKLYIPSQKHRQTYSIPSPQLRKTNGLIAP